MLENHKLILIKDMPVPLPISTDEGTSVTIFTTVHYVHGNNQTFLVFDPSLRSIGISLIKYLIFDS